MRSGRYSSVVHEFDKWRDPWLRTLKIIQFRHMYSPELSTMPIGARSPCHETAFPLVIVQSLNTGLNTAMGFVSTPIHCRTCSPIGRIPVSIRTGGTQPIMPRSASGSSPARLNSLASFSGRTGLTVHRKSWTFPFPGAAVMPAEISLLPFSPRE